MNECKQTIICFRNHSCSGLPGQATAWPNLAISSFKKVRILRNEKMPNIQRKFSKISKTNFRISLKNFNSIEAKNGRMAIPFYFWQTFSKSPNGNPALAIRASSLTFLLKTINELMIKTQIF